MVLTTMADILRMSDAASMAIRIMVLLAKYPNHMYSTHDAANAIKVSEHHLAKVRQRLSKAGLINAERGPGGGFKLSKPPQKITLLEIYEAIEGRMTGSYCLLDKPPCSRKKCIFGDMIEKMNKQVKNHLAVTTLDKLNL
jgi:Rrf2 family protein